MSLRLKLILSSALIIIIPLLLITSILSYYIRSESLNSFTKSSIGEMEKVDQSFAFYIESVTSNLAMLVG